MNPDLRSVCMAVNEIARETGQYIHGRLSSISMHDVEVKGMNNFVTDVDKSAENMIIRRLDGLVHGAGFIAEEGTNQTRGEKYNWVIDPLDGTTNFIHSSPPVAVSIALIDGNMPVLGVIYEIWLQELFYAWQGSPAFLNGKEIKASVAGKLSETLIAVGFPYSDNDQMIRFMKTIEHLFVSTHGVRRLGSAATDLAYVACGRYDGFFEYNLSPWDVAAGAIIVKQAGGQVTDFSGADNFVFGREIVAANNHVHAEFLRTVNHFMKI